MNMRAAPWTWLVALVALFLAACATTGQPAAPVDTFNKKLLVGYSTVEGIAKAAGELRAAGVLSEADRANVLQMARSSVEGMDVARSLAPTDPAGATSRLQVSLAALQALQAYLLQKGAQR